MSSSPSTGQRPAAARAGRGRRAPAEEVAYTVSDSPVGALLLAATGDGLVRLAYLTGADPRPVLWELGDLLSPRLVERPRHLDAVRRELDEYFAGRRRRFEAPLDRRLITGFRRSVLEATAAIPYGEVATYAEVARAAGRPAAARAAGGALGANPLAIVIPCHRVVASSGLGGYGPGLAHKRRLLELEGALPPPLELTAR